MQSRTYMFSLSLLISSPTRALAVCTVRAHSSSVFVSHPRDALTTASCRNNWPCTADTQRGSQSLGALMTIHRSQTAACLACHVGSCSSCEVPADAEAAAVICQRRERRRAREREGVRERERYLCRRGTNIVLSCRLRSSSCAPCRRTFSILSLRRHGAPAFGS